MTRSPRPSKRSRHTRRLALAALLLLGGCVWPMDPVPEWDLSFFGAVRRADTGAPVAGAQVEIRLAHPEDPELHHPPLQGATDANGQFDLRIHERNRVTPPFATIIVTPPAESGLAPRTVGGDVREVFSRISRTGRDVSYDAVVDLAPAP